MEKVIINSYEEFEKLVGQQIGVSEWLEIPQERINQFADATLDHQWIHVDAERAKAESPYKSTIVHGYLTLSLLPYLWNQIIEVNNLKMMVNYGMDKMKFGQAVLSGQSVRLVADLHSLVNLRGVAKAEIKFSISPLKLKTRRRKRWKVLLLSCIISTNTQQRICSEVDAAGNSLLRTCFRDYSEF